MIIQIRCTASKQFKDRTYCTTKKEAEKEVEALKKIYRFNEFKIIPGKNLKIPGPIYVKKSEQEIDTIVDGVSWLMTQEKDREYPNKLTRVLQGKYVKSTKKLTKAK